MAHHGSPLFWNAQICVGSTFDQEQERRCAAHPWRLIPKLPQSPLLSFCGISGSSTRFAVMPDVATIHGASPGALAAVWVCQEQRACACAWFAAGGWLDLLEAECVDESTLHIDSQLCGTVRQSRPKIFELEPSIKMLVCHHGTLRDSPADHAVRFNTVHASCAEPLLVQHLDPRSETCLTGSMQTQRATSYARP